MESDDSSKWMEAMNEELKSMAHNCVWDLIELPNSCKPSAVNGSLRQSAMLKAISNDLRLDL